MRRRAAKARPDPNRSAALQRVCGAVGVVGHLCSFLVDRCAVDHRTGFGDLASLSLVSRHFRACVDRDSVWQTLLAALHLAPPKPRAVKYKTSHSVVAKHLNDADPDAQIERREHHRLMRLRCGQCGAKDVSTRPYPIKGVVPRNRLCDACWTLPRYHVVNKGEARVLGFSRREIDECEYTEHNGSHWMFLEQLRPRKRSRRS